MPVRARFLKHPHGYTVGALDIAAPGAPGVVTVKAIGANSAQALYRAGSLAERIASDPIMAALMPPQALAAIRVAKGMSAAARGGAHALRGFLRHLKGPGAHRLAETLHREVATEQGVGDVEIAGLWSAAKRIARYTPAGLAIRGARRVVRGKRRGRRSAPRNGAPQADELHDDPMPDDVQDDGGGGDDGGDDDGGDE